MGCIQSKKSSRQEDRSTGQTRQVNNKTPTDQAESEWVDIEHIHNNNDVAFDRTTLRHHIPLAAYTSKQLRSSWNYQPNHANPRGSDIVNNDGLHHQKNEFEANEILLLKRYQRCNYKPRSIDERRNSNWQDITTPARAQEETRSERNQFLHIRKVLPRDVEICAYNRDSPLVITSKKSAVKEIMSDVRRMLHIDQSSSLAFFHGDKELQSAHDFEHGLGHTSYPVRLDIVIHPDERLPDESLMRFNMYDVVDGDLTDDCTIMVQMSCGHATTPENLYNYCLSEIIRKKAEVLCLLNSCKKAWDFAEILRKACLSDSERHLFQVRLSHNCLLLREDVFCCPSCGLMIDTLPCCNKPYFQCCYCRSGKFCRTCHLPMSGYTCANTLCSVLTLQVNKTLAECHRKTIVGVPECPEVRACPTCQRFIEHEGDLCKHMDCPFCENRFCFICLSVKTGDYWDCGGAYDRCSVAPVQQV